LRECSRRHLINCAARRHVNEQALYEAHKKIKRSNGDGIDVLAQNPRKSSEYVLTLDNWWSAPTPPARRWEGKKRVVIAAVSM
jgi:phosphoglycerate dehydrogenase-like enzyme